MQTIKTQSLLDSEAINALSVDKDALTAQVEFKGGERYTYRNVALRAIQQLLDNPQQSIGAWVNNNLVDGETTSFVYGYELAYHHAAFGLRWSHGLMVMIPACHAGDPGSIPGEIVALMCILFTY